MGYRSAASKQQAVKIGAALLILIALVSAAAGALKFDLLHSLEARTWDLRLKELARRSQPDPSIKVILIDQASLDLVAKEEHETWPWPRSIYSPILFYLEEAGAKGVAFDMLFTEESSRGPADDKDFAEAQAGRLSVTHAAVPDRSEADKAAAQEALRRIQERTGLASLGNTLNRRIRPRFTSAHLPIAPLLEKAAALGTVGTEPDSDGVFRDAAIGAVIGDIPVLSLSFALYSTGQNDLDWLRPFVEQSSADGKLVINFRDPSRSYRTYPIIDVYRSFQNKVEGLVPPISPEEFKNCWVFIGMSAPGLLDFAPTPVSEKSAGVFFHANALDNILHRDFIVKAPFAFSLLLSGFWIAAAMLAVLLPSRILFQFTALASLLLLFCSSSLLFALRGFWTPAAVPLVGITLAALLAQGMQYYFEGRQHRFLRSAFRHYVSRDVIDLIVAKPEKLALGGERRELTIFFSDIAGFTSISEKMEPRRLADLLNIFLGEMTDTLMEYQGTVDKYVGDAIVAFWNAPIESADHSEQGVLAALACQETLLRLQPQLEKKFGTALKMRIGLHTGDVSVGNFGSSRRFNYTVIGDAANFASRLEGVNKTFGTSILVSEATAQKCAAPICFRKVAAVRVVGKQSAVSIYEPYLKKQRPEFESVLPQYEHALNCYEQGRLEEALRSFQKISADPVSSAYAERITKLSAGRADFSPVWTFTEK